MGAQLKLFILGPFLLGQHMKHKIDNKTHIVLVLGCIQTSIKPKPLIGLQKYMHSPPKKIVVDVAYRVLTGPEHNASLLDGGQER